MQKFLKSMIGDMLQLDHKHELFLKQHNLVAGITDQNRVLSQKETLLESVWCGRLRSCPPRKNKDAVPKQLDPFPVIEKFQIEVPANKVDILTGKFGDTIKRIRMQSATKIDVLKKCTRDNRTPVEIYGTLREFNKAQQLIKEVISKADETPVEVLSSDAKESDIVYVPNDMIGLIIGKKGERVRKMQQRSGARINQIGKENRFRITGTAEAVGSAKASMLEFINEVFSQRAGSTGDPGATGLGSYGVHGNIQTPRPTQQGNQAYKGSGALAQPVPHRPPGSYSYPGPTYQSMQPQRAVLSPGFRSGPPGCYYYPRPAQPPMLPLHEPSPGFRSEYSQRHCKPPQDVQSLAVRSEYYGERGPRLEYHFIPPRSYHEVGQLHQSPRPPQQYHDFIPPPSYHQVGQLHQGPRPPQQYHGFIPPPCYHEVGQLHQSPRPPQQYHDPRLTGCGRYHPRGIVNQGQGGQQLPRPPQLDNESKGQMHHK
uniref:Uncharacterized protein n=1 Tax=Arundo donax TaxID=35708 RepID=A0A0A8YL65_ARUDO